MLLFTGTVKNNSHTVICFEARPTIEGAIVLLEDADWGMTASQPKIDQLARAILERMAIEAVVTRLAPSFGEQVLKRLDSTKGFYLLGQDIRAWLDLELLKPLEAPATKDPFGLSETVQ